MVETQRKLMKTLVSITLAITLSLGCFGFSNKVLAGDTQVVSSKTLKYEAIPAYDGKASTPINGNVPFFTAKEKSNTNSFESYSRLDGLKRCGVAYANLSKELMPTEKRGAIGQVKPTGWHTYKFAEVIEDRYLYNRCHLIAYCLAGENANKKNLITGSRYMNVDGMLPYEEKVAKYIEKTGNHVLYRCTPIFVDNELVCRGVMMEAYSVEDRGKGICFNIFCHNVQPNIEINYLTGEAKISDGSTQVANNKEKDKKKTKVENIKPAETVPQATPEPVAAASYVLNTNTMKIHLPGCRSVSTIKPENRQDVSCPISDLEAQGYSRCGNCHP